MSIEYTCNDCKGYCNSCNSCNSCNTVIGLCSTVGQQASDNLGTFYWEDSSNNRKRSDLSKDDLFFTKGEWNSLIDYIQKAYKLGTKHSASNAYGSDSNLRASDSHPFLEAAMYNEAYTRMKNLSKNNRNDSYNPVAQGDIVKASVLNELRNLANSFELHTYQCNSCNQCNDCQRCNACDNCLGGYNSYCCHTETTN